MLIVRWLNSKEYIKTKFVENLEVNFEVQEQVFVGNVLEQLTNENRKLIFKHLVNIEKISSYRYYVIEIRTPFLQDGELHHNLKLLNKSNLSIAELVSELKQYDALVNQRQYELMGVKSSKKLVEKVIDNAFKLEEVKQKKSWWRIW